MTDLNPSDGKSAPKGALFAIVILAGLSGAAGVALSAVAAHKVDSPALATAAMILMIHASAVLALVALGLRTQNSRRWMACAGLMIFAALLFSGAVSFHALTGNHIFPMAAPFGGSTLIVSWLLVAVLAALEMRGAR